MIEAFKENDDIHRNTAAQVFHMPREMVTPVDEKPCKKRLTLVSFTESVRFLLQKI